MNPLPQSFATMATSRHLAEITYQWNATGVFMVCLCVIVPVRDNTINRFFSGFASQPRLSRERTCIGLSDHEDSEWWQF